MNSCQKTDPPAPGQLKVLKAIEAAGGTEYPSLYKWLYTGWKHGYKLQTLIKKIAAIDNHKNKNGKDYVSLSIRQIQKEHGGGGLDTWQKYLKAFVSWGLLEQYKPHDGRGSIQAERNALKYARIQAKTFRLSGDHVNPTRWYHLPEYTPALMLAAEEKARQYIPSLTKADWIINAGQEEADRIFSDRRGISKKRTAVQEAIEAALVTCIHNNGYATDDKLTQATEAATGSSRRYIASTLRGIRKDLIERYDLQWGRPSREQMQAHGLKGYGYIYTQNTQKW